MEKRPKNQNEQQKATKCIFYFHFHSFAPTLNLWKVAEIKSWFPFGLFVPLVVRFGFVLPVLVFPAPMSVFAYHCSS